MSQEPVFSPCGLLEASLAQIAQGLGEELLLAEAGKPWGLGIALPAEAMPLTNHLTLEMRWDYLSPCGEMPITTSVCLHVCNCTQ